MTTQLFIHHSFHLSQGNVKSTAAPTIAPGHSRQHTHKLKNPPIVSQRTATLKLKARLLVESKKRKYTKPHMHNNSSTNYCSNWMCLVNYSCYDPFCFGPLGLIFNFLNSIVSPIVSEKDWGRIFL